MMTYITQDLNGNITASADWAFPDSIATDKHVVRSHDGRLYFEGDEPSKPELSLDEIKKTKRDELNHAFRKALETAHCLSSTGFMVNADDTASRNVQNLITSMQASGQENIRFRDYENVFHDITLEQLHTLQLDIIAHRQAMYARKWACEEKILAEKTSDLLSEIIPDFKP